MKAEAGLKAFVNKNKWLLLLLAAGLALLLIPAGSETKKDGETVATQEEERLTRALERMEGVGRVRVLLAKGSGRNDGFTGAVIVCDGAASSAVRLRVIQAVSAFTGLGTDRIVVEQYEINGIGGKA